MHNCCYREVWKNACVPLRSGLWQRLTRRALSLAKSLSGSMTESMASIVENCKWWSLVEQGRRRLRKEFYYVGEVPKHS
ncbi:hypothetical protein Hanom_Chr05g00461751 [Helianthus anomalus]